MNRVGPLAKKGVPVAHYCPEPVPYTVSDMGIMNKSPNTYAAKIFVNWFISKEGQIAQFWGNSSTPAHKDFYQSPGFHLLSRGGEGEEDGRARDRMRPRPRQS